MRWLAAVLVLAAATTAGADGATGVVIEPRLDGAAIAEPHIEVAIRSRATDRPRVVASGRNVTRYPLAPGAYDVLVRHHQLGLSAARYHHIEVPAQGWVHLESAIASRQLTIAPTGPQPAIATLQLTVRNPSGEGRVVAPGEPVRLPRGPLTVVAQATVDDRAVTVVHDLYLAWDRILTLDLSADGRRP